MVLDLDQYRLHEKWNNLRFCDHVSLEQHFIELAFSVDEILLRLWQMKSPIDKVRVNPINGRFVRKHDLT